MKLVMQVREGVQIFFLGGEISPKCGWAGCTVVLNGGQVGGRPNLAPNSILMLPNILLLITLARLNENF